VADETFTQANLANWEDRTAIHVGSPGYEIEHLLADPGALSRVVAFDAPRLGDLTGLRVVHLQCHIGTDTLSLARLGATVTGVDFSPSAIAACKELFDRAGMAGRFVEAEVNAAPAALGGETFDLLYTSVGVLNWLPSVAQWARVVAALLAPGGRLFLRESHPVLRAIDDLRTDGALVLRYPYFETDAPVQTDEESTYVEGSGDIEHTTTYEWSHGIGETVTAVLDAGLRLDALVEHREAEYQALPQMVRTEAGRYRLPEHDERLPLMFTLEASAPPAR
jgi:2-polyprenyl-3-methyl-5-hydroxy-6-metoxy-1,4-benzoquinol methylase